MSGLQQLGGFVDGRANAMIGAAAAEITTERIIDVAVGWFPVCCQQGNRGYHLARLTVAALRDVELSPGRLNDISYLSGDALDGNDVAAYSISDRCLAGARRLSVDENGAGSAKSLAATVFGANKTKIISQNPEQRLVGVDVKICRLPVQGHSHSGSSPFILPLHACWACALIEAEAWIGERLSPAIGMIFSTAIDANGPESHF
jgi:hypothetical protein